MKMSTQRSLTSLALLSSLAFACGKKSDSESSESSTSLDPTTAAVSSTFAKDGVAIVTGQLIINAGLRLAGTQKVYAYPLVGGELPDVKEALEIEVDADGTFSVELPKVPPTLAAIKAAKNADGTWDKAKISEIVGQDVSGISDAEITAYMEEQEEALATKGISWILMSVEESGNRIADAESIKFLTLGSKGKALSSLPTQKVKGDLSLGKITLEDGSSEAYAELPLDSSVFDLSAEVLSAMASLNDTSKAVKNVYINGQDIRSTPFYAWLKGSITNLDDYPDVSSINYSGAGMYVSSSFSDLTFGDVCGTNAKLVELVPPSGEFTVGQYGTISATRPFNNSNRRAIQSEQTRYNCGGDDTGFYGASRNKEADYLTQTDLMLNWGTGGSIVGGLAEGLWKFRVDGTVKGAFDFSSSAPFDASGTPKVYVPTLKLTRNDAGVITGASVKLYAKQSGSWVALTDLSQFKDSSSSFVLSLESRSQNGNTESNSFDLLSGGTETGGIFSHDLSKLGGESQEGNTPYTWVNFGGTASGSQKVLTGAAVYYEIFGASYRVEFRSDMQ